MSKKHGRILLVDDDPGLLRLLSIRLRAEGYTVEAVQSAAAALAAVATFRPRLVITDLRMDHMDGIELLEELQRQWPGLRVILITAHGTIPDAVKATQSGAYGFLTKPIEKDELLLQVEQALQMSGINHEEDDGWASGIVARSAVMTELLRQARVAAETNANILITGPTGTGKEILAHAIHKASARREHRFEVMNCSVMAENLMESALFGHAKDAFSGADSDQQGLFELASGGTLVLDEIADMPVRLQVKLRRVIEEQQIRPVGSSKPVDIDVRLISITHKDLMHMVSEAKFREDIYYRLSETVLHVPPLSQRREDVPLLIGHMLGAIAHETGTEQKVYAPEAMELLVGCDWPGNVRQLFNIVRQTAERCSTAVISAQVVEMTLGTKIQKLPTFSEARDEFTRNYLTQLLQISGGNVSQAARLAKRNRTDFYKLLARHRVEPENFKHG
ncbi:MAG: sigma 54-interacting transcriptional regulator [Pseudomonadota bacterium]